MAKSLYLINPRCDIPSYLSGEAYSAWGLPRTAVVADLALPTVAAMAQHKLDVTLCDEFIQDIDFDTPADYVGLTGKVSQWGRMQVLAAEFRKRGKKVLIGGPHASLSPELVQPHADILVVGEMEEIAEQVFSDLAEGRFKERYTGTRPELSTSPLPRWDLYPNDRALMASVQTSRGCPFQCEFCDVIQYLGRKQRHKAVGQVLAELDIVYRYGYRVVFLCDDNFTIYRSRAKELLQALKEWNLSQRQGKVEFVTQISIDAAADEEMLRMCAEAGLTNVFIGIETPNEDSLRETKKRQNTGIDLVERIRRFAQHGILVIGGMMVGFDSDGPDIFERQFRFASATTIPVFTLGALVAPAATPLHARMRAEGRLLESEDVKGASVPWSTNIVPRQMSREQLMAGIQWLANNLYSPASFEARIRQFIDSLGERRDPRHLSAGEPPFVRQLDMDSMELMSALPRLGREETAMFSSVMRYARTKPQSISFVSTVLLQYLSIRHMYKEGGLWEPHLSRAAAPMPVPLKVGTPASAAVTR
ncbi:radical SAM protein [Hyalangium gracile]|uniref:radical SAM protein n=1 Tax=Hyalangium gracile TaxID=394092 RepID=UPI001CCA13A6|nr:radical SAM protein [Hyalangium gracile]